MARNIHIFIDPKHNFETTSFQKKRFLLENQAIKYVYKITCLK